MFNTHNLAGNTNWKPQSIVEMACLCKSVGFHWLHWFYQRERTILRCFNKLSAHFAVQHPYVALRSMLTTYYCIPQEWKTVLHQVCSTKNPFDLRREVLHNYNTYVKYVVRICMPSVSCIAIYQANPSCTRYIYNMWIKHAITRVAKWCLWFPQIAKSDYIFSSWHTVRNNPLFSAFLQE